jgi:tetratricopeptide (TPR) repeat protein
MRSLYALGLLYVALCGALLWAGRPAPAADITQAAPAHGPVTGLTGPEWFQRMKPFCNPVEVETQVRFAPPPAGFEGAAYGAGCYALAGKIDKARELIMALGSGEQRQAANIVFDLAHPVADAGDDKSAGPIMAMVVEFTPDNYMALYHAGASEYALGQPDLARKHLERFLELYRQNDGWRSNATTMLARLDGR